MESGPTGVTGIVARPPRWLPWTSVLLGLASVIATAWALSPLYPRLPTWDEWIVVDVWAAHYGGGSVVGEILESYNGHYIVLPQLLAYGAGLATGYSMKSAIVLGWLFGLATWAWVVQAFARVDRRLLILAAPLAAWMLGILQFEVYAAPFAYCQVMAQFFATGAVLTAAHEDQAWWRTLLAAALATSGMFCTNAGLVAWPACLLAALWRRRPDRIAVVVFATGLVVGLALVASLTRESGSSIVWLRLPAYFVALLGRPLLPTLDPHPNAAIAAGSLAILAAAVAFYAAWRAQVSAEALRLIGSYAALGLAGAGIIALGRSGYDISRTVKSHYVTHVYPLGAALLVLVALLLLQRLARIGPKSEREARRGTEMRRRTTEAALVACLLLPLIQAGAALTSLLPTLRGWGELVRDNELALMRGDISDEQIRQTLHPDPDTVRRGNEVLRRHRLAAYRQSATRPGDDG